MALTCHIMNTAENKGCTFSSTSSPVDFMLLYMWLHNKTAVSHHKPYFLKQFHKQLMNR